MTNPPDEQAEARVLTGPFLLLMAGHSLQALGYASMLLFPLYLHHLHASSTQIGVIMASGGVGGLLCRPLLGWSLDVLGRKPTLMMGTAVLAAGMGMVWFVTAPGWTAIAMRVVVGVGTGTLFTGYFTFAADIVPARRRTEGLALFGISGLVPLVVNPFAGSLGIDAPDVRWFLPLVGVVILFSMVFVFLAPEPRNVREPSKVEFSAVRHALVQRELWPVWLATVAFSGLVAIFMAFATVAAQRRGVTNPAMLWLTYAAGACVVRVVGAKLPERIGPSRVLVAAMACYISGVAAAAMASSSSGFLLAGGLAGLGHGYCFPILTAQVVGRSPDALRGSAMSMFTALWEVSKLFLAPCFGLVADLSSDAVMFGVAAVVAGVAMMYWDRLERPITAAIRIHHTPPAADG